MSRKKIDASIEEASESSTPDQEVIVSPIIAVPRNYTPYYVLLLIVFSFLLGSLATKISYLQSDSNKNNQPIPTQTAQQPVAPIHAEVTNGHFPILGKEKAKITIVEFADPRCPYCKQFVDTAFVQLKKDYIDTGKVKFYWRNFDFLGPPSTFAGNALECANDQGKFWNLHDYLYQNQPPETDTSLFTVDKLTAAIGDIGIDTNQFTTCLNANKNAEGITKDLSDGQKAGVTATPAFFINGTFLLGAQPYSAFKTIIDQELAKK